MASAGKEMVLSSVSEEVMNRFVDASERAAILVSRPAGHGLGGAYTKTTGPEAWRGSAGDAGGKQIANSGCEGNDSASERHGEVRCSG